MLGDVSNIKGGIKMTKQYTEFLAAKIGDTSSVITNLKQVNDIKVLEDKYLLKYDEATVNMYPGVNGFVVVIPVKQEDDLIQKFVAAYYDEDHMMKNVKVMTLEYTGGVSALSFATPDETRKTTGIFEDGEFKRVVNQDDNLQAQGITDMLDCLRSGWNKQPLWIKAACGTACGAIWTGIGAAACAGCLAGFGINC